MTYAEFAFNSSSTQGMGQLFVYAERVVPFFDAMMFGVILLVITFSLYFIQENKKGRGDFPVAFSVGCTVTTILAGILQMVSGFLSVGTLAILIVLTMVSYIWLFYSEP